MPNGWVLTGGTKHKYPHLGALGCTLNEPETAGLEISWYLRETNVPFYGDLLNIKALEKANNCLIGLECVIYCYTVYFY